MTNARDARHTCGLLRITRTGFRHRSTWEDEAEQRARMNALATEPERFGYRRLRRLMEREGVCLNPTRLRRLYAEEKLQWQRGS